MVISLIVPIFDEELAIRPFYDAVRRALHGEPARVEVIFVNDGSQDGSEQQVRQLIAGDPDVMLVDLSRNFGKEAALLAGLEMARGDAVIPIDVDLQDPVEVIPLLIEQWRAGFEVVLAKRRDRSSDCYLKRLTAGGFYFLLKRISQIHIEENVGDFRLLDRKVVDVIKSMPEQQLFMKGMLSWAGFSTTVVEYERAARAQGGSRFNAWKLWNLALDGITSFSTVPLRLWTYVGGTIAFTALVYAAVLVADKLIFGNPVPGYPSLMTAILFLGGVQLIGIGVLGEYIGRIYMESKHRPRYVVRGKVGCDPAQSGRALIKER
ncbi:glycosyltransferase family 2 protein [Pseudomonas sp. P1B16]|jgi:glycosyltransferase involved in cell wall biosynthesis|uniref:glycosyltransferase family 2 protein n=1 Tax=Pseudomonas TaxID=286 RepID=UPI0004D6DD89|nr:MULTISPECIES: glycosyltransferase family 2 protein [Pseudomonas]KEY85342.1 bactoprenol glucosyl transferase [Pseudomonas capeferrum]MCH7298778.1 glycosyltransferase family 2 protein [Pseudomonas capeferrum]MDD2130133.1 glycosyltransferase family 2 protein [Pseudomonas sp. 17391]UDU80290.1 glycosyltransferase family 2 protein [Pseudomonas sp. HN2-3]UPL07086.1 glycosyltransferase [Pseudomonas sp. IsoF]